MRALLQVSTLRCQALEVPSVGFMAGFAEEFHAWEQENTGPHPRDLDLELPPSPLVSHPPCISHDAPHLSWRNKPGPESLSSMPCNITSFAFLKIGGGASLVAQWLRICLPMQETRVRALVWEDPTCRGATRPVSHNY